MAEGNDVRTPERDIAVASALLDEFARATGLEGEAPARRYLWTDAFAVCTCLSLHARTGEARHLERARRLVSQVHRVLGRHRPDSGRGGWLSGLADQEAERHPTIAGLRIGKPLGERDPTEPIDPELEWERDGQYFHYLTRWMHALGRMAIATGEPTYHRWAAELARVAHERFTRGAPGARRMVWKMSVDLRSPLVPSMGHHDPLDGLLTTAAIQDSSGPRAKPGEAPDLEPAIADFEGICRGRSWATDDPLGIGGLLVDALRLAELAVPEGKRPWGALRDQVIEEAAGSLARFGRHSTLQLPLAHRLPFRELGLALGVHAGARLQTLLSAGALDPALAPAVVTIAVQRPLARAIEDAWLDPEARRVATWREHEDINAVTLAATLAPEGYLGTRSGDR
jgi:hypothetical protein